MGYADKDLYEEFVEEGMLFKRALLLTYIRIKCLVWRMQVLQDTLFSYIYLGRFRYIGHMPKELTDKIFQIRANKFSLFDAYSERSAVVDKLKSELKEIPFEDVIHNNRIDLMFFPENHANNIVDLFGITNRNKEVSLLSKIAAVCQVLSCIIGDSMMLDEKILALYDTPEKKAVLSEWYINVGILSPQELKVLSTISLESMELIKQMRSDLDTLRETLDNKYRLLESQDSRIQNQANLLLRDPCRDYDELSHDEKCKLQNLIDEALLLSEELTNTLTSI